MKEIKRIIIKVGSSSLVQEGKINDKMFEDLMYTINKLMMQGKEVILVTSGAIAVGMGKLNLLQKPKKMSLKQACAALGQASLMNEYEKYSIKYNMLSAQILLNHDDFENRNRMENLSNTLEELFKNHILPIVNENDALAVDEIKVGDNDTLAALIASMINADLLVLASDIDGLYDKNPKQFNNAKKIDVVYKIDKSIDDMIGDVTTNVGTGGMATKIKAARIVTKVGCDMAIILNEDVINIDKLINGENIGTIFKSDTKKMHSKDHWMIYNAYSKGYIIVDDGAKNALLERKSLLSKGIIETKGDFKKGDVIFIASNDYVPFAKCITNFNKQDINSVIGLYSDEAKLILKSSKNEIINANNIVLIDGDEYGKVK